MALDLTKIPNRVLNDVRQRGYDDAEMAAMSVAEFFSEYCNWHGLIGWAPDLLSVVRAADSAEIK
jgi:hypothetical protein